ncbi:L,D-transpeptidase family protein [Magnetospira thiophila]
MSRRIGILALGVALWMALSVVASAQQKMQATLVEIHKAQRMMILKWGENTLGTYRIALGSHPIGTKRAAGDGRTPEGNYTISGRMQHDQYQLALIISYPSAADRAVARARAVDPGGEIMIHGQPESMIWAAREDVPQDWTNGSIAVTTREMQEIWQLVPDGTPVAILP